MATVLATEHVVVMLRMEAPGQVQMAHGPEQIQVILQVAAMKFREHTTPIVTL